MNILILNANIGHIGTYVRALAFGKVLSRAGNLVTLCTVSRTSQFRAVNTFHHGINCIEMPNSGYRSLPGWGAGLMDILLRIRLVAQNHFDCVYGFEYQPDVAWPVYLTKQRFGYRFISDWCDWHAGASNVFRNIKLAHRIDRYFEEKIRFQADKLSVISSLLKERAIQIGIPAKKIVTIEEGVDTELIKPFPKDKMRSLFGFSTQVPILATITDSRMNIPVEIFGKIRQNIGEVMLLVIGRKDPEVARTASKLGLNSEIYETGFVSDADFPRYLACADVCFLPMTDNLSNRARWPAKVNDFLAAGKPSVISQVGDIAKLYTDNSIGYLAKSTEEFVQYLCELLRNSNLGHVLGDSARQLAVERLDWKVLQPKILSVLEGY